jgi:hypothetical protein
MKEEKMHKQKFAIGQYELHHEDNVKDAPTEKDIPVPPAEDIPAPIKEPFEEDKPNEPIIDEEQKAPKLIV